MLDLADLADVMAGVLKEATAPLTARLDALEGATSPEAQKALSGPLAATGLTFDDLSVEQVNERTIAFMLKRGNEVAEFQITIPSIIYRNVWVGTESYAQGDAVTWGGSLWIAERSAPGKPDTADSGWTLAVKKGRDGKDLKEAS